MAQLIVYTQEKINTLFSPREHESKWGQAIQHMENGDDWEIELQNSDAEYVILGLPEDIGIRANLGRGGADKTFELAISSLLSIQQNRFQNANKVLLLGHIDFSEEMKRAEKMNTEELRKLCAEIDDAVYPIVRSIIKTGKKLIAIGGGHNNAYPLLKGSSLALDTPINCINIDAHTDYRVMEGRHSGNGFRYAKQKNYLNRYGIFGLHENYNSENVLQDIDNDPTIQYLTFEDIAIRKRIPTDMALNSMISFLQKQVCGIELDLDCIADMPGSAQTKTGWSTTEVRMIIHQSSTLLSNVYLHITEGSAGLASEHEKNAMAKFIAYLVSDYVKAGSR